MSMRLRCNRCSPQRLKRYAYLKNTLNPHNSSRHWQRNRQPHHSVPALLPRVRVLLHSDRVRLQRVRALLRSGRVLRLHGPVSRLSVPVLPRVREGVPLNEPRSGLRYLNLLRCRRR